MNEIDKKVAEYLETLGVSVWVRFTGSRTKDKWEHDSWTISFEKANRETQTFDYNTGIGHRIDCTIRNNRGLPTGERSNSPRKIKEIRDLRAAAKELKLKGANVVTLEQNPLVTTGLVTQAEVLYCLISESGS